MKPDLVGFATKANIPCSDGAVIARDAFKHQDGVRVPLIWQHDHKDPMNVIGHAILKSTADGHMRTEAFLNGSERAKQVQLLHEHGDVDSFSIWAGDLVRRGKEVVHGVIKEVSVVLAGANPGAKIETLNIAHSDNGDAFEEAIIYSGESLELAHADEIKDKSEDSEKTVAEVLDTLSDEQLTAVGFLVSKLSDNDEKSSNEDNVKHGNIEGDSMRKNLFEANNETVSEASLLTPDQINTIMHDAMNSKTTLSESVLAHAEDYGIQDIEMLFPEAKTLQAHPEFLKRDTGWVGGVMSAVRKTPFSRVKTVLADIREDEARAKGYITGSRKKEEVFTLLKRTTGPQTVYKKQKLDRDDIIDITSFDVVAWIKVEMRLMLEEEIARAILIGDGRDSSDEDKIKDPSGSTDGLGIRSILNDDTLYSVKEEIDYEDDNPGNLVDRIIRLRRKWKGTGSPTFYTTADVVADLLLQKDSLGHRYYKTEAELATALRVSAIVEVEAMEQHEDLLGILVNLTDYQLGADKGGEINFFDDFDIDYNQYKYLYETRLSGALTKPFAALVLTKKA